MVTVQVNQPYLCFWMDPSIPHSQARVLYPAQAPAFGGPWSIFPRIYGTRNPVLLPPATVLNMGELCGSPDNICQNKTVSWGCLAYCLSSCPNRKQSPKKSESFIICLQQKQYHFFSFPGFKKIRLHLFETQSN